MSTTFIAWIIIGVFGFTHHEPIGFETRSVISCISKTIHRLPDLALCHGADNDLPSFYTDGYGSKPARVQPHQLGCLDVDYGHWVNSAVSR